MRVWLVTIVEQDPHKRFPFWPLAVLEQLVPGDEDEQDVGDDETGSG